MDVTVESLYNFMFTSKMFTCGILMKLYLQNKVKSSIKTQYTLQIKHWMEYKYKCFLSFKARTVSVQNKKSESTVTFVGDQNTVQMLRSSSC